MRRELAFWRGATAISTLALIALLAWVFFADRDRPEAAAESAEELEPRLTLEPVGFASLPSWGLEDSSAALPALRESCGAWARRPSDRALIEHGVGGTPADWLAVCRRLESLSDADRAAARSFLEREFTPYRVSNRGEEGGLFTGYFEPTLRGSRRRGGGFEVPLYVRPPELIEVDLEAFREDLAGRRIAGRLMGRRLAPFADRAEIQDGGLEGRGLELLWVDDPLDAFFLHIQGSGRVELAEGGFVRVGYAAQNGHPYFPIGRELVSRGALTLEEVSMQSIRDWLEANPSAAMEVLAKNASYVFFRELSEGGPVGSLGVVLTPERSAAVDRRFLPLGAPLWVETTLPAAVGEEQAPWHRLLVAQDTGGAIRGPVRVDVYWGPGELAADYAGRMRQEGSVWLLLPRTLDQKTLEWIAAGADS